MTIRFNAGARCTFSTELEKLVPFGSRAIQSQSTEAPSIIKATDAEIEPTTGQSNNCSEPRTIGSAVRHRRQSLPPSHPRVAPVFRNNSRATQLVYRIDGGRTSRKSTLLPPVGAARTRAVCRFGSVN